MHRMLRAPPPTKAAWRHLQTWGVLLSYTCIGLYVRDVGLPVGALTPATATEQSEVRARWAELLGIVSNFIAHLFTITYRACAASSCALSFSGEETTCISTPKCLAAADSHDFPRTICAASGHAKQRRFRHPPPRSCLRRHNFKKSLATLSGCESLSRPIRA